MSCSNCGKKRKSTISSNDVNNTTPVAKTPVGKVVPKSKTNKKVRVRYYGGGITAKKVSRCASCGSAKGSYQRLTNETIMFASDDEPNGLFMKPMSAGHDYWVTEEQAKYLLENETFYDQAGGIAHKFKLMED